MAETLLPDRTLDIALRLMIPTKHEVRLKRGVHCQVEDVVVIEARSSKAPTSGCAAMTEVFCETPDVS